MLCPALLVAKTTAFAPIGSDIPLAIIIRKDHLRSLFTDRRDRGGSVTRCRGTGDQPERRPHQQSNDDNSHLEPPPRTALRRYNVLADARFRRGSKPHRINRLLAAVDS